MYANFASVLRDEVPAADDPRRTRRFRLEYGHDDDDSGSNDDEYEIVRCKKRRDKGTRRDDVSHGLRGGGGGAERGEAIWSKRINGKRARFEEERRVLVTM